MYEIKVHTTLECSIVRTLAYFDIFNYPLTREEIVRFLQEGDVKLFELDEALNELKKSGSIYQLQEFYSLRNDVSLADTRRKSNTEANRYFPIAREKAKLIYHFPFVKSVMASGSLSKNCMDEKSDLDFFVVTSSNRVWIVRLLLTMYKKVFLRNSHKLFCINYYLDEDHLLLAEQNLFTATELTTLIPLEGFSIYERLQNLNSHWVVNFYPNFKMGLRAKSEDLQSRSKTFFEKVLNAFPLQWVERSIMELTHRRWKKVYGVSMDEHDFNTAFKSEKFVSKAHPRNFQKKVTDQYTSQLEKYSRQLEMPLL